VRIERVLIAGLGSAGARHLRLARALLPEADIRVLRRAADAPVPEGANGCFAQLEQALAFAPQLAVVATPATLHLPTAQALVEAGAHLLVEKPLAAASEGVSGLLDACRVRDRVLLVGYNLRFLPSLRRFREALHAGLVGEVHSVRCEVGQHLAEWRPGTDYRLGASARRELGGGVLLELSHELDYLRWIFGEVQWVSAFLGRQGQLEIDVEDTAHLLLGFAGAGRARPLVASASLDFIRHDPTRACTAIGALGSLRWDALEGSVRHYAAGSGGWTELFRQAPVRDDSYQAQWRHLLACIEGREAPVVSGEDGLQVLRIVEAARRAADSGARTDVPLAPPAREAVA
jgi:predicted dehydrogenase